MKVYVATKFERAAEARAAMEALHADGHEVTADWTHHSAMGKTGGVLVEYLRQAAEFDLDGVLNAEAVVLLHDDRCAGAFVELGACLGLGRLALVVGGRPADVWPIFYHHPRVHHFETLDTARAFLKWTESAFKKKVSAPANVDCRRCQRFPGAGGAVCDWIEAPLDEDVIAMGPCDGYLESHR